MGLFAKKKPIKDYKERVMDCFREMHIKTSFTNYSFRKSVAISFLNNAIDNIRSNYDQIIFILKGRLRIHIDGILEWKKQFDSVVSKNRSEMGQIKYDFYSSGLTQESILIFNKIIDDLNASVNELSLTCSTALLHSKYAPEERTVFIVHGHEEKLKQSLKAQLSRAAYNPVILADMNGGAVSLLDKFEQYANKSVKAIILMTRDDRVVKEDEDYYQARPNVLIELGYFLSILDRKDIVVVCERGCKFPSDVNGVNYLEYDPNIKSMVRKVIDSLND